MQETLDCLMKAALDCPIKHHDYALTLGRGPKASSMIAVVLNDQLIWSRASLRDQRGSWCKRICCEVRNYHGLLQSEEAAMGRGSLECYRY